MTSNHLSTLLQLINDQKDTGLLIKRGLTYAQIAKLISSAIDEGYLVETDTFAIVLTAKGIGEIGNNSKPVSASNKKKWIAPANDNRIDKLNVTDIFLPAHTDLKYFS